MRRAGVVQSPALRQRTSAVLDTERRISGVTLDCRRRTSYMQERCSSM